MLPSRIEQDKALQTRQHQLAATQEHQELPERGES